jgi:hypothetical protein
VPSFVAGTLNITLPRDKNNGRGFKEISASSTYRARVVTNVASSGDIRVLLPTPLAHGVPGQGMVMGSGIPQMRL